MTWKVDEIWVGIRIWDPEKCEWDGVSPCLFKNHLGWRFGEFLKIVIFDDPEGCFGVFTCNQSVGYQYLNVQCPVKKLVMDILVDYLFWWHRKIV